MSIPRPTGKSDWHGKLSQQQGPWCTSVKRAPLMERVHRLAEPFASGVSKIIAQDAAHFVNDRAKVAAESGCCQGNSKPEGSSQRQPVSDSVETCCSHGDAHGQSNSGRPASESPNGKTDRKVACRCGEKSHVRPAASTDTVGAAGDRHQSDKDCCS